MSALWLSEADWPHIKHDPRLLLLDVRPLGDYLAGHLPGAVHFDPQPFALQSSAPEAVARFVAQHAWLFSTLGVDRDARVLVHEDGFDTRAARTAWTLEFLGHPNVLILDAPLRRLGEPLGTAPQNVARGHFQTAPRPELLTVPEQIVGAAGNGPLRVLDTRRRSEFSGESAGRGRAGHIPGALHRDYQDNLDADRRLKPDPQLAAEFEALLGPADGGTRVVTYCGGGGRAAHAFYALRRAGYADVSVYLASWGEWGSQPQLPVATLESSRAVEPVPA